MMASSSAPTDTLVTIKINFEGNNKRFKLPLRDLGPETLPLKLRAALSLKPESKVIFERYSDSTASFVTLDANNPSTYKQLFRAAKAKLKLRLKATVPSVTPQIVAAPREAQAFQPYVEQEEVSIPRQAEPEPWNVPATSTEPAASTSTIPVLQSTTLPIRKLHDWPATSYKSAIIAGTSSHCEIPVSRGPAAREQWLKDLSASRIIPQKPVEKTVTSAYCAQTLAAEHSMKEAQLPTATTPPTTLTPAVVEKRSHIQKFISGTYSVYCNKCDDPIPDVHYHCGICDNGDYDLCQDCVDQGVSCEGSGHWMIKRTVANGNVITSTTEVITPKSTAQFSANTTALPVSELVVPEIAICPQAPTSTKVEAEEFETTRTCNCCVQEFPENNFVTCTNCEDYDLCLVCHLGGEHGHHPSHEFTAAIDDMTLDAESEALCAPGRNVSHQAICDGCEQYIFGVRHKCLNCPDWDYCSKCVVDSALSHPFHTFAPIYEPLNSSRGLYSATMAKIRHVGIYCDGPLCKNAESTLGYIHGDRYKCAICHDTDFCAACESSPINMHNKTHPLVKFKTPVREVGVTTTGSHPGSTMPVMGDRPAKMQQSPPVISSSCNSATKVQTVADLVPKEDVKCDVKPSAATCILTHPEPTPSLVAYFVKDTVQDGTHMQPNTVFEQTWTLKNGGSVAWPAGCSVKFVGGDNMAVCDRDHPASVEQLVRAGESSACQLAVAPGNLYNFSVKMRTPSRPGKYISYWRLTGPTGEKFGHRLWCDISVVKPERAQESEVQVDVEDTESEVEEKEPITEDACQTYIKLEESQLSFPKLEKESPQASIHEATKPSAEAESEFEVDDLVDEEFDEETEDGFMTDEEWDVLDASDEDGLLSTDNGKKSS